MSTPGVPRAVDRYTAQVTSEQKAAMDKEDRGHVVPFRPELHGDDAGWDPYIFSIVAERHRPYAEDRRRKPRTLDAARRRALLIAKGRRRT